MNLIFRTILHMLRARWRSRLDVHDVGRVHLRVVLTDIDILGHMNNGVYPSIMDLGRMDLMVRCGVWARMREHGFYPVMANETITFRKSLELGQRFDLETRIAGYDGKAVYTEQRFVVDGEIYASAMTRARFLKKGGGVVSITELAEVVGVDVTTLSPPAWVDQWNEAVALPNTRTPAPSVWS